MKVSFCTFFAAVLPVLLTPLHAQFSPDPNGPFIAGSGPAAVLAGDFNNDSIPDLAVANQISNSVSIMIGTGLGTFNPSLSSVVPNVMHPGAMAMGDFNDDGYPDLAVVDVLDGGVTVLLNNKSGGFSVSTTSPATGMAPTAIVAGHFNTTGTNVDLAVANLESGTVSVLRGDGTGGFSAAPLSPYAVPHAVSNAAMSRPSSLAAGDFNGDNLTDLAVTNESDNSVVILLNEGAMGFVPTPLSPIRLNPSPTATVNPSSIVAADFNGDYVLDLAVANLGSNTISILTGAGNGAFVLSPTTISVGTQPIALVTADFNGDTYADLAVANYGSDTVTVLLQSSPLGPNVGTFTPAPGNPYTVGALPRSLAVADFNGDGRLDIATANYGEGDVSVPLNGLPVAPVMVSAASYTPAATPCSLVSVYGIGLSNSVPPSPQVPPLPLQQPVSCVPALPTTLASTSASITDSTGAQTPLWLLYVSPTQINALVPPTVATGPATFTVTTTTGLQKSPVTVTATAPSLFTANASGKGVAAAQFLPDAVVPGALMNVFNCPAGAKPPNTCFPVGLDPSFGASVLVLYGTGIRNRAALSAVTVTVNGQMLSPSYAGAAPGSWGEDQINVSLPPALAHTGLVNVTVSVGTAVSNVVTLYFL